MLPELVCGCTSKDGRVGKGGTIMSRTFHDGRFPNLMAVVEHYSQFLKLGLSDPEKRDLVEYLKSL